jgi:glycosidase
MTENARTPRADLLPHGSAGGITFTFEASPDVNSVAVAGTFNSWVGDSCPLGRIGNATWQATLPIATGRHLYKYVVDGRHWIVDPANPWISEDGQNNSCFTVDEEGQVFIRLGQTSAQQPSAMYRRHPALDSPRWLADGVIYQLSVRAFGGTFAGVRERLAYLQDLGVSVIWLMPIHPIGVAGRLGTLGDPYAVRDFGAIDPQLGSAGELRALVDDMHERGMRVILDWTLNRASVDNPLTVQHPDWFTHDGEGRICYAVPQRAYFAGFDFSSRALREYLIGALREWLANFDIDGFRFDDSDITPLDFLDEIRAALSQIEPDVGLISQAYDEFHHLAACDLTYEGGTRDMILAVAQRRASTTDFQAQWEAATFSFPRGAMRMRWIEDKEQGRACALYGRALHMAAAAIVLTLDGVPHILMGQEFNEPRWSTWTCLFDDFKLERSHVDDETFQHYRALIALRGQHYALRQGHVEFIDTGAPGCIAYWRGGGQDLLLVLVNLSEREMALPDAAQGCEILYERAMAGAGEHRRLGAYACAILRAPSLAG